MKRIYLDNAATAPLLPEVREAMAPWLADEFGNPSSLHQEGRRARAAIDSAREILAEAMGCLFGEFLFTSGGTESAHLAIVGSWLAYSGPRRRILLSAADHHCVLGTRDLLVRLGAEVELMPVDRDGRPILESLDESVFLVAAMHANNETGAITEIEPLLSAAKRHGIRLYVDAVQTFPELAPELAEVDLIGVSAHKLHGPKGIGGLRVKGGIKLQPLIAGGGQERDQRAGTENISGIVGFAAAVAHWRPSPERVQARDRFRQIIGEKAVHTIQSGRVLDGHAHLRFPGIAAESMLIRLDRAGVAASSGAACSSGSLEPSHVLLAMGYSQEEAVEGLRFTFGRDSTIAEAENAAKITLEAADQIRSTRPSSSG